MDPNELMEAQQSDPSLSSPTQGTSEGDKESNDKSIRKRTKTGCTTCRLRRIKCDEAKPECNNCKRSKRPCGGEFSLNSHSLGRVY